MQEDFDESRMKYVSLEQLMALAEAAKELDVIKQSSRAVSKHLNTFIKDSVNKITFEELLEHLEYYPRVFSSTKPEDKEYD
jgi:hypothetical protein